MKKMVFLLCCCFFFTLSNAQNLPDSIRNLSDHDLGLYYKKKASNQRTVAWIMLGTGIVVSTIGATQFSKNYNFDGTETGSNGTGLVIVGTLATFFSIPIFISAAKNNGRANVLLRNKTTAVSKNFHIMQASIGLSIRVGR